VADATPPGRASFSDLKEQGNLKANTIGSWKQDRTFARQTNQFFSPRVDPMSINYWETNRYRPSLRSIPESIQFLGYVPYDTARMGLGERIITLRFCLGLSREELAEHLGVDEST
jgi:DNA-binding XRE family transcriptional regulator